MKLMKLVVIIILLFLSGCASIDKHLLSDRGYVGEENSWAELESFPYEAIELKCQDYKLGDMYRMEKFIFICIPKANRISIERQESAFLKDFEMVLYDESRIKFLECLKKYYEWKKITEKEGVVLEKNIAKISIKIINEQIYSGSMKVDYISKEDSYLKLTFAEKVLGIPDFPNGLKKFPRVYLYEQDIEKFYEYLQVDYIKKSIEKEKIYLAKENKNKQDKLEQEQKEKEKQKQLEKLFQ